MTAMLKKYILLFDKGIEAKVSKTCPARLEVNRDGKAEEQCSGEFSSSSSFHGRPRCYGGVVKIDRSRPN